MSDIKTKDYQFAGAEFHQNGTLVQTFARFCGIDQDPASLPTTGAIFGQSCVYPTASLEDITRAIVGDEETSPRHNKLDLGADRILAELGPEKCAELLLTLGKARKEYDEANLSRVTFVPVVPSP